MASVSREAEACRSATRCPKAISSPGSLLVREAPTTDRQRLGLASRSADHRLDGVIVHRWGSRASGTTGRSSPGSSLRAPRSDYYGTEGRIREMSNAELAAFIDNPWYSG